jgi:hypothetical protein
VGPTNHQQILTTQGTLPAVFVIGTIVTLIIAKGLMQANDFAKSELGKSDTSFQGERSVQDESAE